MKILLLVFFSYLTVSFGFPEKDKNALTKINCGCEGNACEAIEVYFDHEKNGYIFKNKNGDEKDFQIGNDIQLKVFFTIHPMANCSRIKYHKLKYASEWNAGDIGLCSDRPFEANYIDEKGVGNTDFRF